MPDEAEFKLFTLQEFDLAEPPPPEVISPETESEEVSFRLLNFDSQDLFTDVSLVEEKSVQDKITLSQDYSTDDFQREDSLLTNAEAYAKSIREGAQLYKEQLVAEHEIALRKSEENQNETRSLRKAAEAERLKMIEDARAEVQSIKDEAFKEGFEAGREQGMQQRYREAEPQVRQLEETLKQIRDLRQVVRFQAEQELLQLALLISRRVVIEELRVNPEVIDNILRSALKEMETHGKIRVALHPEDYEFLERSGMDFSVYLKAEQALSIQPNPDVVPGSVFMESDEEVINFTFQKRFEELEEKLSKELAERHARQDEVDMDAHDFSASPAKESLAAVPPENEPGDVYTSTDDPDNIVEESPNTGTTTSVVTLEPSIEPACASHADREARDSASVETDSDAKLLQDLAADPGLHDESS